MLLTWNPPADYLRVVEYQARLQREADSTITIITLPAHSQTLRLVLPGGVLFTANLVARRDTGVLSPASPTLTFRSAD